MLFYYYYKNLFEALSGSISDVKLETEIEEGLYSQDIPRFLSTHNNKQKIYHPRMALQNAINDWLPEFYIHRHYTGLLQKPHLPVTSM